MSFAFASLFRVFFFLVMLSGMGWFVVPVSARIAPHPMVLAPMAGMLAWPASTLLLYVGLRLPFAWAAAASGGGCILISLVMASRSPRPSWHSLLCGLGVMLAVSAAAAILCMTQSLRLSEPTLFFLEGTDLAGYAQVADWLSNHRIIDRLRVDPDHPYHSWPAAMMQWDPRFGTFALLALVETWVQVGGLFTFDSACAIILATTSLAMAGMFGRRHWIFLLLLIGMLTSQWYDFGRTGFLGKMTGYPAALFIAGMIGRLATRPFTLDLMPTITTVAVLSMAAGTLYPGFALAFLVAAIVLVSLALQRLLTPIPPSAAHVVTGLLIILVIAMVSGQVARPLGSSYPETVLAWPSVVRSLLGLDSSETSILPLFGMGAAWTWTTFMVLCRRDHLSLAYLIAPALLTALLALTGALNTAAQLVGFIAPALLIGMAIGCDAMEPKRICFGVGLALSVMLALCFPRFASVLQRYGGAEIDPIRVATLSDMKALAARIGSEPVLVDVASPPQLPIELMVQGAETLNLRYTPAAWKTVMDYRHWPPPTYSTPATYRIVRADQDIPAELVLQRTRQFLLLGHGGGWNGYWQLPRVAVGPGVDMDAASREILNLWSDGWIGPKLEAKLAGGVNDKLRIRLDIPNVGNADWRTELKVVVNTSVVNCQVLGPGSTTIEIPLPDSGTARLIELLFSETQPLAPPDQRRVSGRLLDLALISSE